MSKVSFLGAGSWGTALAIMLAGHGHQVTLWSKVSDEVEMLQKNREHMQRLPGIKLPEAIDVTDDISRACSGQELIVFAVASPFVRSVAKEVSSLIPAGQKIVNVAKGIEEDTLETLRDILAEEIPQADISVLSGPSHAEEVAAKMPTTVVVGSASKETALFIQEIFMNEYFRVYISPDIIGIELGGSVKNVIALAAGACDGLGYGDNTKAALMTRGIAEITRLGFAMGAKLETLGGLSGIGDLIVTCTSKHSRNHNAGYLLGKGYSAEEAMREVKQVVEGVYSAKAVHKLAQKYHVSMPIVEEICKVLFEGEHADEVVKRLMTRDKGLEYPEMDWE